MGFISNTQVSHYSFKGFTQAKGDGVTDDSAKVQLALSASDRYFFIEPGDYVIGAEVQLNASNLVLMAAPGTVRFIMPSSAGTAQNLMRIMNASNVTFEGIEFISEQVGTNSSYGIVYSLHAPTSGLSFRRCKFSAPNFRTNGIKLVNETTFVTRDVLIEYCDFIDVGQMGIEIQNHTASNDTSKYANIVIRGNTINGAGFACKTTAATTGSSVSSNQTTVNFTSVPAQTGGIIFAGAHSFSILSSTGTTVVIAGDQTSIFTSGVTCTFLNGYGMGISLSGFGHGVKVEGNTIDGCYIGSLELVGCSSVTVSGNTLKNSKSTLAAVSSSTIVTFRVISMVTGASGSAIVWGDRTATLTAGSTVLLNGQLLTVSSSSLITVGSNSATLVSIANIPSTARASVACDPISISGSRRGRDNKIVNNVCEDEHTGSLLLWLQDNPTLIGNTFILSGFVNVRSSSGVKSSMNRYKANGVYALYTEGTSDLNVYHEDEIDQSDSPNAYVIVRAYGSTVTRQKLSGCRLLQRTAGGGTFVDSTNSAPAIEMVECTTRLTSTGTFLRIANSHTLPVTGTGTLSLDSRAVGSTGGKDGFTVSLTGNTTINSVTPHWQSASGYNNGQRCLFTFIQDATGGRTVSWGSTFKFPVAWSNTGNTANTRSTIVFVYDGTYWWAQSANAWA